ncbi:MAG: methylamine utilization protein MauE [Actinomycetota bacterium]|nr:methylamine utilization protein MauE [Actinomycetota bacterium]MDQ2956310.1 methylamine utilization protein MauE [Actinomycetota bacterium]
MQYLALACRAAIVVVFAMAVAGKVLGRGAFAEFTRSIVGMNAVPHRAAGLAARATVLGEGLTVVLVVLPWRVTGALGCALAAGLTLLFSLVIMRSLRQGNRAPCRCFGRSSTPLGRRHLVRNAILLVVSLIGAAASLFGDSLQLSGALVGVVAGLFVGLIVAGFDDLAQLVAPASR